MKYIFLGLLFLSCAYAESQWRDKQGNVVEKTKSMNSHDGFGVQILSVNEKDFFKTWNTPSETVNIDVIDKIHKNDALIFPILFGGCKINENKRCNLSSDFLVVAPDGSVYTDVKNMLIFNGKPYPNHGLNVSNEYIKIIIEKKDLLGEYKVKAHVTDTIKNITLDIEKSFIVVDNNITIKKKKKNFVEPYKPTAKDINVSNWMTYAYKNGNEKDMNNIIYMLNSKLFTENKSSLFVMAVFISERFKIKDSYLLKYEDKFNNFKGNSEQVFLFALKQANTINTNILYKKLLKNIKDTQFLNYIKSVKPFKLLEMEITQPSMIDVLWASFMATGKKVYVEKIINILAKEEKGVNNLLLIGSAKWSLLSNIQQHKKVFDICKDFKTNDKNINKHLKDIFQKSENK